MNIPTNTVFDVLLNTIKTKMEAIETVQEVIVGTYDTVALEQADTGTFPVIEILPSGISGEEYSDQQNIYTDYNFEIVGHTKADIENRITGADIKTVESLGSAIKIQFYSLNNDSPKPHDDFLFVKGDFELKPYYKEFSDTLNSCVFNGSIRVVTGDTDY